MGWAAMDGVQIDSKRKGSGGWGARLIGHAFFAALVFGAGAARADCLWELWPADGEDPYASCGNESEFIRQQYARCAGEADLWGPSKRQSLVLRREQLKYLYDVELIYLSRVPPSATRWAALWEEFRARWIARITAEPDLLSLDALKDLGDRDRCTLRTMMGQDCAGAADDLNYIDLKRDEARQGNANRDAHRKLPAGLAYDLMVAQIVLNSYEWPAAGPGADTVGEDERRARARTDARNAYLGYYPELSLDSTLARDVEKTVERIHRANGAQDLLRQKLGQTPLSLQGRKNFAEQALAAQLKVAPMPAADLARLEQEFLLAQDSIFKKLGEMIVAARAKPASLREQDHVLVAALRSGLAHENAQDAAVAQMQLCANKASGERTAQIDTRFHLYAGTLALVTGVGTMVIVPPKKQIKRAPLPADAGRGARCVAATQAFLNRNNIHRAMTYTMFGSIGVLSAYDIYATAVDKTRADALYLQRVGTPDEVERARANLAGAVGWGFVNFALMTPLVFLRHISNARQVAAAANNTARVARLDRMRRATIATNVAANAALAAYMGKEGYHAAKELYDDGQVVPPGAGSGSTPATDSGVAPATDSGVAPATTR